MRKNILVFILSLSFCGCNHYTKVTTYKSPDGKYLIDVVTEDQAANDPDPFLQHVSIRKKSMEKPVLPGNIIIVSTFSPSSRPKVIWRNNHLVQIELDRDFGESFDRKSIIPQKWNDIKFEFIIPKM